MIFTCPRADVAGALTCDPIWHKQIDDSALFLRFPILAYTVSFNFFERSVR